MAEREKSAAKENGLDELPTLIARLGDNLVTLLESKLGLLKVEIKEDVAAYLRGFVAFAASGIVAAVGLVLTNVAIALLIAGLLEGSALSQPLRYAAAFLLLGGTYLIVGLLLARNATRRMASIDQRPEKSVVELDKDKQWLTGEAKKS